MGQEQKAVKSASSLTHTTDYDLDPRLAEYKRALPSYFSAIAEKIIQEITNMINEIPQDPIEQYLTYSIDTRFNHQVSSQDRDSSKCIYGQNTEWYQLSNQQRFLALLNAIVKQYSIEQIVESQYQNLTKNIVIQNRAFSSLRSPLPFKAITLSQQLILRMLLRYYLKLIKLYANSGEKHIMRFHEQTGRQLCLMIIKGHLQLIELYGLFYQFVYIDKHPFEITNKLAEINRNYHWKCLRTQYSITVEQKQLQKLRAVARLYLDQLYLSSLREAQDPQIKNSDDILLPIKIFPISRVKDKPRS